MTLFSLVIAVKEHRVSVQNIKMVMIIVCDKHEKMWHWCHCCYFGLLDVLPLMFLSAKCIRQYFEHLHTMFTAVDLNNIPVQTIIPVLLAVFVNLDILSTAAPVPWPFSWTSSNKNISAWLIKSVGRAGFSGWQAFAQWLPQDRPVSWQEEKTSTQGHEEAWQGGSW